MQEVDRDLCLETALEAGRRAGQVLESWRRRFEVREKGRHDLVTSADLEAQQCLRDVLLCRFPNHRFLGEEDAGEFDPADPTPTWIVDPLDGTTNYVHDCPFYCTSIGLRVGGTLLVGVVVDPTRGETFHAVAGGGAFLNDKPIRATTVDRLDQALLATGFPYDPAGQELNLKWFAHLSVRVQSLRRTGSTALNLAYVAAGRLDGFWAFDSQPWDMAAGAVLIREAGGRVTRIDGSEFDVFHRDMLASAAALHPAMVRCLAGEE